MIYINEWLPNPVGKDTAGEFVEIFNGGKETVNLAGWYLKTKATTKTKFVLSGEIQGGGFAVLKKPELKIALGNTDGELFLYDADGKQIDRQQFFGSAPEGKSFSRMASGQFVFSEPTPGEQNKFSEQMALIGNVYPTGVPLNKPLGVFDFVLLTLGVAAVLTGLIIFVLKKNENLSKLFFGGDETSWQ